MCLDMVKLAGVIHTPLCGDSDDEMMYTSDDGSTDDDVALTMVKIIDVSLTRWININFL